MDFKTRLDRMGELMKPELDRILVRQDTRFHKAIRSVVVLGGKSFLSLLVFASGAYFGKD